MSLKTKLTETTMKVYNRKTKTEKQKTAEHVFRAGKSLLSSTVLLDVPAQTLNNPADTSKYTLPGTEKACTELQHICIFFSSTTASIINT